MRTARAPSCSVLLTLLAACGGELRIDAASEASFAQSTARIMESLDPDRRLQFGLSLTAIVFDGVKDGRTDPAIKQRARQRLHGKSVQEVIDLANELRPLPATPDK